MNAKHVMLLALAALPVAFTLSLCALRFAHRRNMLDVPVDRSLHTAPTPRGGGVAIFACVLAAAAGLTSSGHLPVRTGSALLLGSLVVGTLGWIDDRRGLSAAVRGTGYLAAAVLAAWLLPALPQWQWLALPLAALGVAWLTNLYNFMDGADGIAATQGISAGLFGSVLFLQGGDPGAAAVCAVIAAACAGFLPFNLPPARLFMGDVGSCVLGYVFGVLALHGAATGTLPLAAWLLLLAWFIVDATLTLARRVAMGEKWYSPHRTHAYQWLVQSGLGHRGLLLRFVAVNVLLCGPLALIATSRGQALPAALALVTLGAGAWYGVQRRHGMFDAGKD